MTCHDVFNGDADGLCALHQLRLAAPRDCTLVTGPKCDVRLLARVDARKGDSVTVLDISVDVNRAPLQRLLERGVEVTWFDHHYAGDVPRYPRLSLTLDTEPAVCTAMLVDRHLGGRYRAWAVVAAYGDNLRASAARLASTLALAGNQAIELEDLGRTLAYAGCGESVADLFIAPDELYRSLHRYHDPLRFVASEPACRTLQSGTRCRSAVPAVSRRRRSGRRGGHQWPSGVAPARVPRCARRGVSREHTLTTGAALREERTACR